MKTIGSIFLFLTVGIISIVVLMLLAIGPVSDYFNPLSWLQNNPNWYLLIWALSALGTAIGFAGLGLKLGAAIVKIK